MISIQKDDALAAQNAAVGILEVQYPDASEWDVAGFRQFAEKEIASLKTRYKNYDRAQVFGENVYYRFFKKFKKTYPVMMQFESILLKGREFPHYNPITEVVFLAELTTLVLSGTHDVDRMLGGLTLFLGTEKAPFVGLRGDEAHTYPGDICGRDDGGIIFSMIAGADSRTCCHENSRHIFYPVFGVPGQPEKTLAPMLERLQNYVSVLAKNARMEAAVF